VNDDQLDSLLDPDSQEKAAIRGAQPALIEAFGIRGLYGYRTISLESNFAATILIAKNGTGKTTLLGALDAFLSLQIARLRNLEFDEIFCRIRGCDDELVISHDDVVEFLRVPSEGEFFTVVNRTKIDPDTLFDFFLGDYKEKFENYYADHDSHSPVNVIARVYGHNLRTAIKACDEAVASLFRRNAKFHNLQQTLQKALQGYEIVYLPTYRRIELALTDSDRESPRRRAQPKFKLATGSLHTGNIQFGLSDISDRLKELNNDIIIRSNQGYREISENIINELIGGFEVKEGASIPTPDELKLFFARLETGGRMIGPYYPISAPDFDRIYSGEGVPPESRKFLSYFLSKLNNVIKITKEIEHPVEDFVLSCNKYLLSIEPSTLPGDMAEHNRLPATDAKYLRMDRADLSVAVESVPSKRAISLDALSSGEKQMISLFARLYLYPKRKIVLIDEPELSLSIDWQKGILVDALLAPQCEQVIAITHSPFVFDNSLERFARSLRVTVSQSPGPEAPTLPLGDDGTADGD